MNPYTPHPTPHTLHPINMHIALASDHAGFDLKQHLMTYLKTQNIPFTDYGCPDKTPMDYVDTGILASESVANGTCQRGILICGTGLGMSMIANKVRGIRASLCQSIEFARLTRQHNDANILVLAGRFTDLSYAIQIVDAFLNEDFSAQERHINRIEKITKYENK